MESARAESPSDSGKSAEGGSLKRARDGKAKVFRWLALDTHPENCPMAEQQLKTLKFLFAHSPLACVSGQGRGSSRPPALWAPKKHKHNFVSTSSDVRRGGG